MTRTKKPLVKVCMWTPDESVWETACGESFMFMECDGPVANNMKFCCYCGLSLREPGRFAKPKNIGEAP